MKVNNIKTKQNNLTLLHVEDSFYMFKKNYIDLIDKD